MKRLVTYLLAAFAVVCVGIAFIVSPVEAPQSNSKATKLAYEISTSDRPASNVPVEEESASPDAAATPEADGTPEPATTAAVAPQEQNWAPTVEDDRPEAAATDPAETDMAAVDPQDQPMPPAGDPDLPWSGQHPQPSDQPEQYGAGQPQDPGAQQPQPYEQGPPGYDSQGQHPQAYDGQGQYPQGQYPQGPSPEGQGPQGQAWNGQAPEPGQEDGSQQQQAQEQWVRLVGSASMHSNPNDESAMLFAFPAGRTLRVVSQTEGWVEVTDPQSAATGWIRTDYVQGSYAPGQQQAYQEPVYEEQPRQGRGWFRRNTGGLTDMIERAFSGY
jgi:hypothetical protein